MTASSLSGSPTASRRPKLHMVTVGAAASTCAGQSVPAVPVMKPATKFGMPMTPPRSSHQASAAS